MLDYAGKGDIIGAVGDSGNAKSKPPHLHYSVISLVPYVWKLSTEKQGWKRMFYMNPADSFVSTSEYLTRKYRLKIG